MLPKLRNRRVAVPRPSKTEKPSLSMHSLGHSYASLMLSKGVPIAVVSERMGHANQDITLKIYSHAMPADSNAASKVWKTR